MLDHHEHHGERDWSVLAAAIKQDPGQFCFLTTTIRPTEVVNHPAFYTSELNFKAMLFGATIVAQVRCGVPPPLPLNPHFRVYFSSSSTFPHL